MNGKTEATALGAVAALGAGQGGPIKFDSIISGNGTSCQEPRTEEIPEELKRRSQWVVWRLVERDGKQTKVPFSPRTSKVASTTDPTTWGSFEEAWITYRQGGWDGIGFVFTEQDPFIGVDLDKCRDPETGEFEEWAKDLIHRLDSYTEYSPSCKGAHVILKGSIPAGHRRGRVEIYNTGRYFTVTGHHVRGTPSTVEERQEAIGWVYSQVFGEGSHGEQGHIKAPKAHYKVYTATDRARARRSDLSDEEIVEKATNAANGEKFQRLWNGRWEGEYESQSEADLALCNMLAFYTRDPIQIDRLFRKSGLYRPKWDEPHYSDGKTYGEVTIEKALQGSQSFTPPAPTATEERKESAEDDILERLLEEAKRSKNGGRKELFRHLATKDEFYVMDVRPHVERELGLGSREFDRWLRAARKQLQSERAARKPSESPYVVQDGQLCYRKFSPKGEELLIPLTNFVAEIEEELIIDDGERVTRELVIRGSLHDGTSLPPVKVPVKRFRKMNWVVEEWGSKAVVNAGYGNADRAREAIQRLSPGIRERHVYAHTGWREIDGQRVYLSKGGAIAPRGVEVSAQVELPSDLDMYDLPSEELNDKKVQEAVKAVIGFTELAPLRVTVPTLATMFAAPLMRIIRVEQGFTLWILGPTGAGKTSLLREAASLYGGGFERRLPASWSDTENSLEMRAFLIKDGVLVVDDYAPQLTGRGADDYRKKADRLIRGVANHQGRGRLDSDSRARPTYRPRGLVASTGEDIPVGSQSLTARMFTVRLESGDLDWDALTVAQEESSGLYPIAFAAFLRWLLDNWEWVAEAYRNAFLHYRSDWLSEPVHRRLGEIVALLKVAAGAFLEFAQQTGAITSKEWEEKKHEWFEAIESAAEEQNRFVAAENPVDKYFGILRELLAAGKVCLGQKYEAQQPCIGNVIGWEDGSFAYLLPQEAFKQVQETLKASGERLGVSETTLRKMMERRGVLVRGEDGRLTTKLRPPGREGTVNVLKIKLDALGLVEHPEGFIGAVPPASENREGEEVEK